MTEFQQLNNFFGSLSIGSDVNNWIKSQQNQQHSNQVNWDQPHQQLQVPQSIKSSQFINVNNDSSSFDPWLNNNTFVPSSSGIIVEKSPSTSSLTPVKSGPTTATILLENSRPMSKSEDLLVPPSNQLSQQYSLLQQQIQQQQLENEQSQDIEEEINGQSRYKTELCRSFAETGICRYGFKCQFAHGRDELRPVMRHPKYKTETCKTFHTIGSCPYGSRCRFIHSKVKLTPEMINQINNQNINSSGNSNSLSNSTSSLPPSISIQQQQQQQQQTLKNSNNLVQTINNKTITLVKSASEKSIPNNDKSAINWTSSWGGADEAAINNNNNNMMNLKNQYITSNNKLSVPQQPQLLSQSQPLQPTSLNGSTGMSQPLSSSSSISGSAQGEKERRLAIFRTICSNNSDSWSTGN